MVSDTSHAPPSSYSAPTAPVAPPVPAPSGRLPRLVEDFDIVSYRFLMREPRGAWREATADAALEHPSGARGYALGEMILSRQG